MLSALVRRRLFAAEAAASGQLKLSFVCPHKTICRERAVRQLNVSTAEGDMGILANHLPTILQLRPGPLTIIGGATGKGAEAEEVFFVSGGFVTVNPDSSVQVAALEAFPMGQFDKSRIDMGMKDALERVAKTAGRDMQDTERVEAHIQQDVFKALDYAYGKYPPK